MAIYFVLGRHGEKPLVVQRKHPALQNMQFLFYFFVSYFALLDPVTQLNKQKSGSESATGISIQYLYTGTVHECIFACVSGRTAMFCPFLVT